MKKDPNESHVVDTMRYLTDNNAWYLTNESKVELEFRKGIQLPTLLVPPSLQEPAMKLLGEEARKTMEKIYMGVMTDGAIKYENIYSVGTEEAGDLSGLDAIVRNNAAIAQRNLDQEGVMLDG